MRAPGERLDSLTSEVVITSGRSKVFHAPSPDGGSVCGVRSGQRRELQHIQLRAVPCRHCFTDAVYEAWDGPPRHG